MVLVLIDIHDLVARALLLIHSEEQLALVECLVKDIGECCFLLHLEVGVLSSCEHDQQLQGGQGLEVVVAVHGLG